MNELADAFRRTRDPRVETIIEALDMLDLTKTKAWKDLDVLSTHTRVDGIEAENAGIIIRPDGTFRGICNVYVGLEYKEDGEEFEMSDAFPAWFEGYFDRDKAVIDSDSFRVETASFFAGEKI